jgi:nicotinamidase-related amidase
MTRALLIIDIQNDYFPGGAFPLVAPEDAAAAARRVLDAFRAAGEPVVHVQHIWDAPDAAFFRPDTDGVALHALGAPADGELVVRKEEPNAFLGTALEQELRSRGVEQLVVAGMMSSTCVDATVRAASDLGLGVTVVHDGCAAPNLAFGGLDVPGALVHAAFMAALSSDYATVVSADELLAAS